MLATATHTTFIQITDPGHVNVCAVLVPQPGQMVTLEELVHHLRHVDEVAAFKWPEKLILIDELPRNAVGKILKRELRERFFPKSALLAGAQA